MSDFYQHGSITTLHNLTRESRSLKAEIASLSQDQPIALIIPCHGPDLTSPAIPRIVQGIRETPYLSEVIISMNGLPPERESEAYATWDTTGRPTTILFNDRSESVHSSMPQGKGLNIWAALRHLTTRYEEGIVAVHDCDILSYESSLLDRLVYPIACEKYEALFVKGYYSRVKGRLYGRVTRLFLIPFLRALIRVAGHHPLLDFLDCFRYPLAGEFSGTLNELASLPVSSGWGLEIGLLTESFRHMDPRRIFQVDLGIEYDHKHQPLQEGEGGLARMCREIAIELLRQLMREGVSLDTSTRSALLAAYQKLSEETVVRYAMDAHFNALEFDIARELEAVGVFGNSLEQALGQLSCNQTDGVTLPAPKHFGSNFR